MWGEGEITLSVLINVRFLVHFCIGIHFFKIPGTSSASLLNRIWLELELEQLAETALLLLSRPSLHSSLAHLTNCEWVLFLRY